MSQYQQDIDNFATLKAAQNGTWEGINPEFAARMKVQNRFKTGLDIARYTASIMRKDMAEYDCNSKILYVVFDYALKRSRDFHFILVRIFK